MTTHVDEAFEALKDAIIEDNVPSKKFDSYKYDHMDVYGSFVDFIGPLIDKYADHYAERGLKLPPAFSTNPSGWTEALRDMQRAIKKIADGVTPEEDQSVRVGLDLFGKYVYYMRE